MNEKKDGQKQSRISNRGFASMSPEQQRAIASKGGQAAHKKGVAHEWTSEEARAAGKKGGQASRKTSKEDDRNAGQQSQAPEKTDVSRSTTTPMHTEEPDVTPKDEMNPQRQDTQQNRATNS